MFHIRSLPLFAVVHSRHLCFQLILYRALVAALFVVNSFLCYMEPLGSDGNEIDFDADSDSDSMEASQSLLGLLSMDAAQHSLCMVWRLGFPILQCSSVHYGTTQYNTIQCSIIQCRTIQYSTMQYNTIQNTTQYNAMQYNTSQHNTIQYNTIQYNTIQYNTIQYNAIQYNTIQYNTIQYNTIQYSTVQYNTIQCNAMQCNAMQCNAIQYNTIQYNTIQYNTIQYNTIQYNTIQYNTIQYDAIQYNTIAPLSQTGELSLYYMRIHSNGQHISIYNIFILLLSKRVACPKKKKKKKKKKLECEFSSCSKLQFSRFQYAEFSGDLRWWLFSVNNCKESSSTLAILQVFSAVVPLQIGFIAVVSIS